MNLHDGLRIEFNKVKEQYQGAIAKLDELALSSKEPVTNSSGENHISCLAIYSYMTPEQDLIR